MIQRTPHVVRRQTLEPRQTDESHRILPPQPPSAPPPIDAYMLVGLWKRARMAGDMASAGSAVEVLEVLATRPKSRAEGEHDEQLG